MTRMDAVELAGVLTRRGWLRGAAAAVLAAGCAGCGSILYPERVGQPRGGPLDWKVVALDGLGLLLFFVPGVVAFAVDFYNGAIFLPAPCYGDTGKADRAAKLAKIDVPPGELTEENIARIVSQHTQHPVQLAPGDYQTAELASLDQFWTTHDKLAEL